MSAPDINAVLSGFVDRGIWYYYDTATVAAGASTGTSIQFFSDPISATKTKLLTNMVRGNTFPPPRCLILDNIGWYFSSKMLKADIDNMLDGCYMEFRIDDKIYFEGHLWKYATGCGLTGVSTQTAESVYTLGAPDIRAGLHFGDFAKYIAPLQQFSLTLTFPTAVTMTAAANGGTGLRLVSVLDGLTDRAVQ
jgi:hypothetical protein